MELGIVGMTCDITRQWRFHRAYSEYIQGLLLTRSRTTITRLFKIAVCSTGLCHVPILCRAHGVLDFVFKILPNRPVGVRFIASDQLCLGLGSHISSVHYQLLDLTGGVIPIHPCMAPRHGKALSYQFSLYPRQHIRYRHTRMHYPILLLYLTRDSANNIYAKFRERSIQSHMTRCPHHTQGPVGFLWPRGRTIKKRNG